MRRALIVLAVLAGLFGADAFAQVSTRLRTVASVGGGGGGDLITEADIEYLGTCLLPHDLSSGAEPGGAGFSDYADGATTQGSGLTHRVISSTPYFIAT